MDHPHPLSVEELTRLLGEHFPQSFGAGAFYIEECGLMHARLRMPYKDFYLRPGGTISGPAMFTLADVSLYVAILATIGWVPLAVTTNLTINFVSKPQPADMLADCRLIKLGKALAVGEVHMRSEGSQTIVAQASGTYSIPPAPRK
ncbi:MAG: PaaI family thioesterase [Hyphomicrobiales bacterium]|nr:PaaI family thioesterase [Hyphomicrobiales bacterium]